MQLVKLHLLLFLLSICALNTSAQQFKERVYLKDSVTFYEGYVIEQAPAKYVKIYRLKERDTVTVALSEVLKLTKEYVIDTIAVIKKIPVKKITTKYTKVAFVELLGAGILYSLNYDMRTAKGKRNGWGFRAGIEYINATVTDTANGITTRTDVSFTAIPIVLNYLFGNRKSFLELGVGATYFKFKGNATSTSSIETYKEETLKGTFGSIIGNLNIGYRHVPYKRGFMYRIAYTPLLLDDSFQTFIGIGLGYHF